MKAAAALLLLLSGCRAGGEAAEPPPPPRASSASARWVAAQPTDSAALLQLPARALPPAGGTGAVTPPFAGRVVRVHVQAGTRVAAGAPVVDFLMPEVAAAAAAYVAATVRLGAYGERANQLQALRAEGLARVDELSEARVRLAEAQAEQVRARAVLRSAGVAPEQAKRIADAGGVVPLRSPIAGLVTEVNAPIGESRETAGQPLARVAAAGATRVEARLGDALPENARFEFVAAGRPPVAVVLAGIAPSADPRDGLRVAWFDVQDAHATLPAATPGVLRVQLGGGAALVPARSVVRREGHTFVHKRQGDGGADVEVSVLMLSGSEALVRGAVQPGDLVATEAAGP